MKPSARLKKKWSWHPESTPNEKVAPGNLSPGTARELLQNLSGDDWADTATPPLGSPGRI